MAERIAAVGSDLRGRKIAISISPSFFLRQELKADSYAGNFSLLAASATIFGTVLDFQLKSEIAKRMEQFPDTLEKSALLRVAVHRLASGRPIDRALFVSIWPLGVLQNAIFDLQDHFATLVYISSGEKKVSRRELHEILEPLEPGAEDAEQNVKVRGGGALFKLGADGFQERVADAMGWMDLELLFRALAELRTQVLVLSLPLDGTLYDAQGIPWSARQFYYDKLRDMAQRHGVALMEFEDHDRDSSFQAFHREHPTSEGWMYYDLALNDFFHTRKWNRP